MVQPNNTSRRVLIGIIVAVAAWGVFHAVGVYFGGINWNEEVDLRNAKYPADFRRSLVVLASVLGFLGFWGLMLWLRSKRDDKRR